MLVLGGLGPDEVRLNESKNRVIFIDNSGQEFFMLTRKVRGMLEDCRRRLLSLWLGDIISLH